MSQLDEDLELEEMDEEWFAELRARRRRLALWALGAAAAIGVAVSAPWSESIEAKGRTAPQAWARIRSEAPGVVREVLRRSGDAVEEGDVVAVLDADEQRDALENARLTLARERQKLADLELRLTENAILREGADASRAEADRRSEAAGQVEGSRLAALEPIAQNVLDGVRAFADASRGELAMDRASRTRAVFRGDEIQQSVGAAMDRYVERAEQAARKIAEATGEEAASQFRFELESVRFSFTLASRSMEEILLKRELVSQDYLAPSALRELVHQLEREAMDLAQSFRGLTASGRSLAGSPAERAERVRAAEEARRLLANEAERLETERASVTSTIAQAELAVRAAERHSGKTAIRAPIRGVLSGGGIAEFDAVGPNAAVGVVENVEPRVLKVQVGEAEWQRVAAGQPVRATSRGRELRGVVAWKVPLAGQEVRDQKWNVLVQLEGDGSDIDSGEKVVAEIEIGRRSLVQRALSRGAVEPSEPRIAVVDDPTEQRTAPVVREIAAGAAESETAGSEISAGADGG
jgi:multidrug resistance efflux pump